MNGKRVLKTNRKAPVALVAILVLLCCAVAGTVAFLIDSTGPVKNTFEPSHVTTYVEEKFENGEKKDVRIQNTGDIDAYIRVAVVVNWADEAGNVYGEKPVKDTDYTISYNTGANDGWFKGSDGYYYCKTAITPNASTPVLISSCAPVTGRAPAGYALQVTILADGIQSVPTSTVAGVWGVTVSDNGTLTPKQ